MIKILDILNELEINNPSNHNDILLKFLQKYKNQILYLILRDKEIGNEIGNDDEEQYENIGDFYSANFEKDDNGNPSIGNGIEYFSFSLKKEELMDFGTKVENFEFQNKIIYYINYSI